MVARWATRQWLQPGQEGEYAICTVVSFGVQWMDGSIGGGFVSFVKGEKQFCPFIPWLDNNSSNTGTTSTPEAAQQQKCDRTERYRHMKEEEVVIQGIGEIGIWIDFWLLTINRFFIGHLIPRIRNEKVVL